MSALCDHFIEVADDPWGGCYCKLRAGHTGAHVAHYRSEAEVHAIPQSVREATMEMIAEDFGACSNVLADAVITAALREYETLGYHLVHGGSR